MTAQQAWLDFWLQALAEPIGLLLFCEDPMAARARLYKTRADAQDAALANMQVRLVDMPDGNLAIVHINAGARARPAQPSLQAAGLAALKELDDE